MDGKKYEEVIRVCCLQKDLEMMEFGDQTEIGERAINLSGGQKQLIQLARAVYQDADVFSAVDAQTGLEIFKKCVRGVLKSKTIVLVTHQMDFLHNVDLILVLFYLELAPFSVEYPVGIRREHPEALAESLNRDIPAMLNSLISLGLDVPVDINKLNPLEI